MTTKVSSSVLSTTGVSSGTYGGISAVPVITVGADGRITSAANVSSGVSITDDNITDASYYPSLFTENSGFQTSAKVSSTKLYFNPSNGTLNATSFNSLSDSTQKTNVVKIENATETLNKIDGVEFDLIESGKHSSGVIAQKLEEILPFLVETNEQGIKSVNYAGLIAYLIESNKELSKRIENLENQ